MGTGGEGRKNRSKFNEAFREVIDRFDTDFNIPP